jgi:hypothetical protein
MSAKIKTPFGDALETVVPSRGSKGGEYDSQEVPDTPSRNTSPNGFPELHRDTAATSKSPSKDAISGTKTPFKDAV